MVTRSSNLKFPPIPKSLRVRLKSRAYETFTNTSSPIFSSYGLVEFLGVTPSYFDSLFGLYKSVRIHASKITVRLINMGAEPIILGVSILPIAFPSNTPTLNELLDSPDCSKKTVSGVGGLDKIVITKSTTTAKVLGSSASGVLYTMNQAQAASTTPLSNDEPAWIYGISAHNGTTQISCRVEFEMEYDAEFFSLDSI